MEFFDIVFGPDSSGYPRYMYWVKGIIFSLEATVIAAVIGLVVGIILALFMLSNFKPFKKFKGKLSTFNPLSTIATLYIDLIRGTPVLIQLFFIYLVVFANSDIPKVIVGAVAFGINSGAYVAEIIRAGIQGLDKGQMEAARSLGMPYGMAMRYIIIPQAIKNILPTLVSEFIILLKETSIIGFIGGFDIFRSANSIISQTYTASEPLIIAAAIYLILTTTFSNVMRKVERRMRASDLR